MKRINLFFRKSAEKLVAFGIWLGLLMFASTKAIWLVVVHVFNQFGWIPKCLKHPWVYGILLAVGSLITIYFLVHVVMAHTRKKMEKMLMPWN